MNKDGESGILPIVAVIVILGILLVFAALIVVVIAPRTVLALALAAGGLYLLVSPGKLSGAGPTGRFLIPMILIVAAVAVYFSWLKI